MASLDSLDALLHQELKDLYDAEKQLTKALPKMIKKAGSDELRQALEEHFEQTENHVHRLEQVFEQLGVPAKGKKCEGMQHLIAEGQDMISETQEGSPRDAMLIAGGQKVEHYEIAAYGTVRTWASLLGHNEVVALLEETLDEEKEADRRLTSIADESVNWAAANQVDEEGEGRPPRVRHIRGGSNGRSRERAADLRGRSGSRLTAARKRRR